MRLFFFQIAVLLLTPPDLFPSPPNVMCVRPVFQRRDCVLVLRPCGQVANFPHILFWGCCFKGQPGEAKQRRERWGRSPVLPGAGGMGLSAAGHSNIWRHLRAQAPRLSALRVLAGHRAFAHALPSARKYPFPSVCLAFPSSAQLVNPSCLTQAGSGPPAGCSVRLCTCCCLRGDSAPAQVPAGQRVSRRRPGPCSFLPLFPAPGVVPGTGAERVHLSKVSGAAWRAGSPCCRGITALDGGPSQDGRWSQLSTPVGGGIQQLSSSLPLTAGGSLKRGPVLNKGGSLAPRGSPGVGGCSGAGASLSKALLRLGAWECWEWGRGREN